MRKAVRIHCGAQRRQKSNAQNQKCSKSERSGTNRGCIRSDLATQFNGDLSHDTICAMTVVTAMPVAKAKLRANITKIVLTIVSHVNMQNLPRTSGAFCDGRHVSSVFTPGQKGYKILMFSPAAEARTRPHR
jgi:hypothetical protein